MGIGGVVNCFRTCIFVILKTTPKSGQSLKLQLWIAFELVSSSYWKQLRVTLIWSVGGCELLSNLYLRHIENNVGFLHYGLYSVVNCFRTCIFVILKTTIFTEHKEDIELWIAFELVSSSYWKQLHINNVRFVFVVNCFRTCIFVILKTTPNLKVWQGPRCELLSNLYLRHIENNEEEREKLWIKLWIAFELVSSSYWKQRSNYTENTVLRCELLSNLYLRHIENNQTDKEREEITLWIAFELVSSSYWKQQASARLPNTPRCELLSNLYLRHIENNQIGLLIFPLPVVNCFRTCIFVILKTTLSDKPYSVGCCELLSNLYLRHIENNERKWKLIENELWIAFELVSSSYWKQPYLYNYAKRNRCELLSNLYLRHIENNLWASRGLFWYVVNCFRTCIFVILKTTVDPS